MTITFQNEAELLVHAKKLEGMRIQDISTDVGWLDNSNRKLTKSVIANIIETDYFGIPTNSHEDADFKDLGIELKVSPLKPIYGGTLLTTKERNVLGIVDYQDVLDHTSWKDNSRLDHKLKRMLFVFYVHDDDKPAMDWRIACTFIWSPTPEQEALIQNDYYIIRDKIFLRLPNSEKHNKFLATCPKHEGGFIKTNPAISNPNSLCYHPTMDIAEKRGFCIRNKPLVEIIAGSLGYQLVRKGNSIAIPVSEFKSMR